MIKFICKNCKHWEKSKANEVVGSCRSDKFLDVSEYYSWHLDKLEDAKYNKDGLHYFDKEGYGAGANILTGADFGCIHFECNGIVLSDGEIVVKHPALVTKEPLTSDHTE